MTSGGADAPSPAEHRALRELYATARQLERHWRRLAQRLGGQAAGTLAHGADVALALVEEVEQRGSAFGVPGFPAAIGAGSRLGDLRNGLGDALLERNQALRLAVLDVQHVRTLLAYAAELAATRGDVSLADFHLAWGSRLEPVESAARQAALDEGRHPDRAILPARPDALGRAGQRLGQAAGSIGEAIDTSPLGRLARRLTDHS